jgi:hypothetical protein
MDEYAHFGAAGPGKRGTIVSGPHVVKPLCRYGNLKFRCSAKQRDRAVTLRRQRPRLLG